MADFFTVRPATALDAEGILHAHYSAVHQIAQKDYPPAILKAWSPPVDAGRIRAYRAKLTRNATADPPRLITFVAVCESGNILGYAELERPQALQALYVALGAARRGVAGALLRALEDTARGLAIKKLELDSSLTAAPFYTRHGFVALARGCHLAPDGLSIPCIRMEKTLR